MNDGPSYEMMQPGDEDSVSELVHRVFMKHIAPYFGEEGIREFLDYATADKLAARSEEDHFVIVAKNGERMAGMIEIRENSHISLFFVERHGSGIGRELLRRSVQLCRTNRSDVTSITVHSSPNAVPIYERLGFATTGPLLVVHGIAFIPMALDIGSGSHNL